MGLMGVALGAVLAPLLDWVRVSRRAGEQRRAELFLATEEEGEITPSARHR